jgi:hypothetical protein
MNHLLKLYSRDYTGEWINVTLGKDKVDRRFIKPNIVFENPSGNAICLGNGKSRLARTLAQIENSNKRKILRYYNVMYGCNGIYREWTPDFLVTTNQLLAAKLEPERHSIMYANQEIARRYPESNLIPGNHRMDAGALAAYLAAFHGAKRVYLFGYDGQPEPGVNNNIYAGSDLYPGDAENIQDRSWIKNLKSVVTAYDDVEFFRITANPEDRYRELLRLPNYKPINFARFISLADL